MAPAGALVLEAEGFVPAARSLVRAEDGEFGLLEAAGPHPLEDSFHQDAPQADPAPSVPDRDSDSTHVTGLRVRPCVAVRRADRFPARIGDEQDRPDAVERAEPPAFLIEVRRHLIEQEVDLLSPDAVHVPRPALRLSDARGSDDTPP